MHYIVYKKENWYELQQIVLDNEVKSKTHVSLGRNIKILFIIKKLTRYNTIPSIHNHLFDENERRVVNCILLELSCIILYFLMLAKQRKLNREILVNKCGT